MIEILNKSSKKYLYSSEINILQTMLNNEIKEREINNKCFYIIKNGEKTATVKIYKISKMFIFFKSKKLLTTLKIKHS